jgi:hypothetical protein
MTVPVNKATVGDHKSKINPLFRLVRFRNLSRSGIKRDLTPFKRRCTAFTFLQWRCSLAVQAGLQMGTRVSFCCSLSLARSTIIPPPPPTLSLSPTNVTNIFFPPTLSSPHGMTGTQFTQYTGSARLLANPDRGFRPQFGNDLTLNSSGSKLHSAQTCMMVGTANPTAADIRRADPIRGEGRGRGHNVCCRVRRAVLVVNTLG